MQFIQSFTPLHISVKFQICPVDAVFHQELSSLIYTKILEVNEAWANQLTLMRPRNNIGEKAITHINFVLGTYENYSAQTFFEIQQLIESCCNSFADSKGGYESIKPVSF